MAFLWLKRSCIQSSKQAKGGKKYTQYSKKIVEFKEIALFASKANINILKKKFYVSKSICYSTIFTFLVYCEIVVEM